MNRIRAQDSGMQGLMRGGLAWLGTDPPRAFNGDFVKLRVGGPAG